MTTPIIKFYQGEPNTNGRTLQEIWKWDRFNLEHIHNYIQWMFPIIEPSYFNRETPKLTQEDIDKFHEDNTLKTNLIRSLMTILEFWGLKIDLEENNEIIVCRSINFETNKECWVEPKNHNHLRMTRVIHCLKILGLEKCAQAFYEAITDVAKEFPVINQVTLDYWRKASLPSTL